MTVLVRDGLRPVFNILTQRIRSQRLRRARRTCFAWFSSVMVLLWLGVAQGADTSRVESEALEQARAALEEARRNFQGQPHRYGEAWRMGKAAFDYAEFPAVSTNRAKLAEEGIAACSTAVTLKPDGAEGHYFLAMNRGQLARTKLIGALRLVTEIEKALKAALALDARVDHAGPDRSLGLLYFQAPGWPASIGNKKKARQHLLRAFELDPVYPGNGLALLEAFRQWHDMKGLRQTAREFESRLGLMRERFAGKEWEWSWVEWNDRWRSIQSMLRNSSL